MVNSRVTGGIDCDVTPFVSVTIVMAFRQCFFDTPGVTKIVLRKTLQNFNLYLLAQELIQIGCSFFARNIHYRARLKGLLSVFSGIVRLFSKTFSGAVEENTLTI